MHFPIFSETSRKANVNAFNAGFFDVSEFAKFPKVDSATSPVRPAMPAGNASPIISYRAGFDGADRIATTMATPSAASAAGNACSNKCARFTLRGGASSDCFAGGFPQRQHCRQPSEFARFPKVDPETSLVRLAMPAGNAIPIISYRAGFDGADRIATTMAPPSAASAAGNACSNKCARFTLRVGANSDRCAGGFPQRQHCRQSSEFAKFPKVDPETSLVRPAGNAGRIISYRAGFDGADRIATTMATPSAASAAGNACSNKCARFTARCESLAP